MVKKVNSNLHRLVASLICLVAVLCFLTLFVRAAYVYSPFWPSQNLEKGENGCLADIPEPESYQRVPDDGSGYADFLRSLPLSHPDSVVRTWEGTVAETVMPYCYRVIDLPLINWDEQCADVCIRLRAEYLLHHHRYKDIHFDDTRYQTFTYRKGNRRGAFNYYLTQAYKVSNTESLIHEMPSRRLEEIQPGDVFVYDAQSRADARYGHAIMVADVAVDGRTGRKVCLLVQGSTPTCSIHLLRNLQDSILSPWFEIDPKADTLDFGFAKYLPGELRYFQPEHLRGDSLKVEVMNTLASILVSAYPGQSLRYEEGKILFPDGTSIAFDDHQAKTYLERLDRADVEDMFAIPYDTTGIPGYMSDAGRIRCEKFLKKMYGASSREVYKHLEKVAWFGDSIKMTTVNGVADSLRKVAEELSAYPELEPYLLHASTFNWRDTRGTSRISAHSFGIAIDLNVEYSNFWRWDNKEASETDNIGYENQMPMEIVRVFERHGFIWGGRWYHYDTMHFEFRPEILSGCR